MEINSSAVSYRSHLQQHFSNGYRTLIGVIILTLVNLGLLLSNTDSYLLFSVSVPYYLTWFGKLMDNQLMAGWTANGTYTLIGLGIGAVILAAYFLCWLLSKKNGRWLYVAAGLLCLDLLALIAVAVWALGGIGGSIVDILIHIVAIYQICKGASSWKKLQSQPPEVSYTVVTDDL